MSHPDAVYQTSACTLQLPRMIAVRLQLSLLCRITLGYMGASVLWRIHPLTSLHLVAEGLERSTLLSGRANSEVKFMLQSFLQVQAEVRLQLGPHAYLALFPALSCHLHSSSHENTNTRTPVSGSVSRKPDNHHHCKQGRRVGVWGSEWDRRGLSTKFILISVYLLNEWLFRLNAWIDIAQLSLKDLFLK